MSRTNSRYFCYLLLSISLIWSNFCSSIASPEAAHRLPSSPITASELKFYTSFNYHVNTKLSTYLVICSNLSGFLLSHIQEILHHFISVFREFIMGKENNKKLNSLEASKTQKRSLLRKINTSGIIQSFFNDNRKQ